MFYLLTWSVFLKGIRASTGYNRLDFFYRSSFSDFVVNNVCYFVHFRFILPDLLYSCSSRSLLGDREVEVPEENSEVKGDMGRAMKKTCFRTYADKRMSR